MYSDGLVRQKGAYQMVSVRKPETFNRWVFFYGTIYMRIDMDYYYCLVYNMDNRHMDYYCYLHPLQL